MMQKVKLGYETKTGADGKTYYNFKTPKASDQLEKRVVAIENEIKVMKKEIENLKSDQVASVDAISKADEDEIDINDIPF